MSFESLRAEENEGKKFRSHTIRIGDGEILAKFNRALASIVTTEGFAAQMGNVNGNLCHIPQKRLKLTSSLWYPEAALHYPVPGLAYHYLVGHERGIDSRERSIHDPEAQAGILQAIKEYDEFEEWIDGSTKLRYSPYSREAQAHISGWAMKYTNNHNKFVLKKTCVGVLLCSNDCTLPNGLKIVVRPAISDKVRERQMGQNCPNATCTGTLVHRKCTGNNGYPVTHFWVHQEDGIYFESKGSHDHFRPQARRATPDRNSNNKASSSQKGNTEQVENTEDKTEKQENASTSSDGKKYKSRKRQHAEIAENLLTRQSEIAQLSSSLSSGLLRGYSVEEEDLYICVTVPETETLFHRALSHDQTNITTCGKLYLLCQTFQDVIPGFDLLETRMISRSVMGWPVVMATLYRQGTKEGQIHHMKTLARLCSTPDEDFFSPRWQMVIHDFPADQAQMVTEAIVNMIINTQVQTLLKVFQYKSVSSLYKMLREKITSSLQSYDMHFELCKREIITRLQDPLLTMKFRDMTQRLTGEKCSAQEYVSTDCMLSGGVFGSVIREFWNFWGSNIVAPKVFAVADELVGRREKSEQWQRTQTGLTFPSDPQKVTLHHMAEAVVTWCQYQIENWPQSVVQESMAKFTHLRPEDNRLHYALERPGSAFHRPVTYPTLSMPRFHWC
ncbi:uncharacterized protein LOC111329444 [Stylophora pistillata]|uniref:uncharacterized protein LOC111329444 n=1 Tax=Stylophora pistillata TaxID=50429 RepID=UPI000C043653|nr:uncharacterized protein LOC111329444 [Stylophora pistillata]XP_022789888.1 uncharacterized protein LOC111329444 [Stylophora pistillata]